MGPKAPDVAAVAMTREAQPATPGAPRQELAIRVSEQVRLKRSSEALKIARGTLPEQHKSDQKAEQMGVKRDKNGKKERAAGSPELARFDRIKTADASARRFLTEGYDKLPAADKTKMRDAVLKAARKSPLIADQLRNAGVNQAKLNAFAERIIKEDPKFAAEAAENFDRWIASPDILDAVTPLEIKATEAQYKKELADYDFKDVDDRLTDVVEKLKAFDATKGGTKTARLAALRTGPPTLETIEEEYKQYKDVADEAQANLASLIKERDANRSVNVGGRSNTDIETSITRVTGELNNARTEAAARAGKIKEAEDLVQEKARLDAEKPKLEREKFEKEKEQKLADLELTNANGLLGDATRIRESEEKDVVKGIEDVFLRAAEGTLDGQTEAFLEAADEQVEAFAAQAKEANEKAVDKILQERYYKTEKRRKWLFGPLEDKPVIKRAEVNKDFATLMKQGPEATMRQILAASKNPTTKVNYTTAEIDDLLNNKEYVEKVQPEMLKYLMAQRMVTSGITQEDTRIITMSTWGDGIITSALEKNKEVRFQVEGLMGEGYLDRHGFIDRLKSEMSKNPALWLLILAGGLVTWPVGVFGGAGALAGIGSGMALGGAGATAEFGRRAHEIAPEDEAALAA